MRNFVFGVVFVAAFLCLVPAALADNFAYAGSNSGAFGTMDLSTGVFTLEGNSGQTLAGLAVAGGDIFASSYHTANGTLFLVDPATGALTTIGSATGVDYDDFGSTTSGLYAVSDGAVQDLYSIDPTTGAATLIGPTGLGYDSWRGLSTNSGTLYFSDGPDLYTLSTTTGAATLVGAFGGSAQMGVLLTEDGVLYGGDDVNNTLDTINPSTGLASAGPSPSVSFGGSFYGLAPYPVPSGVTSVTPEPSSFLLLGTGLGGLLWMSRRKIGTRMNLQ
jgi:PEP-CTERM motif